MRIPVGAKCPECLSELFLVNMYESRVPREVTCDECRVQIAMTPEGKPLWITKRKQNE